MNTDRGKKTHPSKIHDQIFWTGSTFFRERFSWKQFRTKPSNDSFQQILSFFLQRAHEEADTMRRKISCQCVRDGENCVRDSNIQCDCQPWDRTLLWANCSSKGFNHRFLCVKPGFECFFTFQTGKDVYQAIPRRWHGNFETITRTKEIKDYGCGMVRTKSRTRRRQNQDDQDE